MVYTRGLRTNVNLADNAHRFASTYAHARGMSLSAALSELVLKAQVIETAEPNTPVFRRSSAGIPLFPPDPENRTITAAMVRKAEEDSLE
jgi:hypothetical protein